jgi:ribosomal protein S18 acetylase RimI-like enzyme
VTTGGGSPPPSPTLRRATFAALARCYMALVQHVAGTGVRVGSRDGYSIGALGSDIPDLNRVMSADAVTLPGPDVIDAVLAELADYVAVSWWIPPGPCQADLEARLAERGLVPSPAFPEAPGMIVELERLASPERLPGVEIEVASTGGAAYEAALVGAAGFGTSGSAVDEISAILRRIGERPDGPARYFLARLERRPVATAIGVVDGKAVGIHSVTTLPDARRRGIGSAITLAALLDGRRRGAQIGVLETSAMAHAMYRRLGFRDVGVTRVAARGPA